jgi:Flp pilus assembly protein TadG
MRALRGTVSTLRLRFAALPADAGGATLIEFALLLPILALFLLGTIDVSRGIATKFGLEQAAQRTIEIAALGGRPRADYSFLRDEAATAAGVPVANVTLNQWLECRTAAGVSTRQSSFSGTCATGQTEARYVEISIVRDYMPTFSYGPLASGMANVQADGSIRLTADAGVRVQ